MRGCGIEQSNEVRPIRRLFFQKQTRRYPPKPAAVLQAGFHLNLPNGLRSTLTPAIGSPIVPGQH